MQLDHTFQDMLRESYDSLFESTMTSPQRKTVAALRSTGWRIKQDTKKGQLPSNSVELTNGVDRVHVDAKGKIEYLNETFVSIDALNEGIDNLILGESMKMLSENEEFTDEEEVVKRGLVEKVKILFDNLTIITLQRGKEVFVVTMSRHSNEYVKLNNNNVVESGDLHNRRTAKNLIDRLQASGFEEVEWKSAIPRGVMKFGNALKNQIPTIAILFVMYSLAPGPFTMIISSIIRLSAWLISPILNALPFPSLQVMSDQVEEALRLVGLRGPEIDGFTGAGPVN